MERWKSHRAALRALGFALTTGAALLLAPAAGSASSPDMYTVFQGKQIPLVQADFSALEYPKGLDKSTIKEMGRQDAEILGFEVLDIHLPGGEIAVKANLDTVRKALKAKSGDLTASIKAQPVFYYGGNKSEAALLTIPDRLIVAFNQNVGIDVREKLLARYDLTVHHKLTEYLYSVESSIGAENIPQLAVQIAEENQSIVRYTEPVMTTQIESTRSTAIPAGDLGDPLKDFQWHLNNSGDNTTTFNSSRFAQDNDIDAPRAWNWNTRGEFLGDGRERGYYGNPDNDPPLNTDYPIIVGVFDTGTDFTHEDWETNDSDPENGSLTNDSAIAVIDSLRGFDYLDADPDPKPGISSHGTAVAGVIAGQRNNGVGGIGVAPGVKIYTYRLLDDGRSASSDDFANAVLDAATKSVDIGNHSYSGYIPTQVVSDAHQFAFESGRFGRGMLNFCSSSNDYTFMKYPALYDYSISVGGVSHFAERVSYASYGGKLDFVGPTQEFGGPGIVTNDIMGAGGSVAPDPTNLDNPNGNYDFGFNGTSASCPVIAGVAALTLAEDPTMTSAELFNLLASTADRVQDPLSYFPKTSNAGRMDYVDREDGNTTKSGVFGQPNGFRKFTGLYSDGFNVEFGYGRPNPYNAITNQLAESPLRDYINNDTDSLFPGLDEEVPFYSSGQQLDYGELKLVYQSNFDRDARLVLNNCTQLLEDGILEGEDEFDECLLNNSVPLENKEWFFSAAVFTDCETGEFPPVEIGYELLSSYPQRHPIEFAPDNPETEIVNESFPQSFVVVSSSRHTFDPGHFDDETNPFPPFSIPATNGDHYYNPRGRYIYQARPTVIDDETYDLAYRMINPAIDLGDSFTGDVPVIVEVTLMHELGIENALTGGLEFDSIAVRANGSTIGTIIGDSSNTPVFPLLPPSDDDPVEDNCGFFWPIWNNAGQAYAPEKSWANFYQTPENKPVSELNFRTYRFPAYFISSPMSLEIRLVSGDSYLPEYEVDEDGILTGDQVTTIHDRRDSTGFAVLGVNVYIPDTAADPLTGLDATEIINPNAIKMTTEGTKPVWSAAGNEVFFVGEDSEGGEGTVNTVLADAFTRIESSGLPQVVTRASSPLFTVCDASDTDDCIPSDVISLDANTQNNWLMYVKDGQGVSESIFLVRDDGFDERPLIPMTPGETPIDDGTVSAVFARSSPTALFTNGSEVYSVDQDGTNLEFIIDSGSSKLTNFTDLASDPTDSIILFTANNKSTTSGIYYTIRGLNAQGSSAYKDDVIDWTGTNELQGDVSPTGSYLAFASNRTSVNDSTPSSNYKIYILTNLNDTINFNRPSTITAVNLNRDIRLSASGGTTYASAFHPSFSPSGQYIAFRGLLAGQSTSLSEIGAVQYSVGSLNPIPQVETYPTPPANQTPYPTMTPNKDDRITQSSRTIFDTAGDGWIFGTDSPDIFPLLPPDHATSSGSLSLTSSTGTNQNTFGYFTSPPKFLPLFPDRELQDLPSNQLGNLHTMQSFHYLARYYVRRTTPNALLAPTLRGRIHSADNQEYHAVIINSTDANGMRIPSVDSAAAVDVLFQPAPHMYKLPQHLRHFSVSFDLLNIDPNDDPTGGYIVDRVEIFRIPEDAVEEIGTIKLYTFDTPDQFNDWGVNSGPNPLGFTDPTYTQGASSLEMSIDDPEFTFGYWQSKPGKLIVNPVGISGKLYVRMKAVVSADEANPYKVPQMRIWMADESYAGVSSHGMVDTSASQVVLPSQNDPRTYYAYHEIPDGNTDPFGILATWDAFSFEDASDSNATSTEKVRLESVEFDLVRIRNYPQTEQIP